MPGGGEASHHQVQEANECCMILGAMKAERSN